MSAANDKQGLATESPDKFRSIRRCLSLRWAPGGARVMVLGDSMLDACIVGAVDCISPEAPVPVVRQARTRESAGGTASVAANVCSLGVAPTS